MSSAKWRFWGLAVCAGALSILTGCASLTVGTEQSVKVETLGPGGKAVEGAECQLANDKGKALVVSGQTALVRRSGGDLAVNCILAGYPAAAAQVVSRANAGLAGNIVIGGGIGAAIDIGTGAAYSYPAWLQLVFGEERLFDRNANRSDTVSAGTWIRALAAPDGAVAAGPATPVAAVAPLAAEPTSPAGALRKGDALD